MDKRIITPGEASDAYLTILETQIRASRKHLNDALGAAGGMKFNYPENLLPRGGEHILIQELRDSGWNVVDSDPRDGRYYIISRPTKG